MELNKENLVNIDYKRFPMPSNWKDVLEMKDNEIIKIKKKISEERKVRFDDDMKAFELLKIVKKKFELIEQTLKDKYERDIALYKHEINVLKGEKIDQSLSAGDIITKGDDKTDHSFDQKLLEELEMEINSLKSKSSECEEIIKQNILSIEDKDKLIEEKQCLIQEKDSLLHELNNEISVKDAEIERLKSEIDLTKNNKDEYQKIKEELDYTNNELIELRKAFDEIKNTLNNTEDSHKGEVNKLNQLIEEMNEKANESEKSYKDEVNKLKELIEDMKKKTNESEKSYQDEVNKLNQLVEDMKKKADVTEKSYQDELITKNKEIMKMKLSESKTVATKDEKTSNQLTKKNEIIRKLKEEIREVKMKLTDYEIKLNKEIRDKERLTIDMDLLRDKIKEKDKDIKEISDLKSYQLQKTPLKYNFASDHKLSSVATVLSSPASSSTSSPSSSTYDLNKVGLEKWRCYEELKKENDALKLKVKENETIVNNTELLIQEKQNLNKEKISLISELEEKNNEISLLKSEIDRIIIESDEYKKKFQDELDKGIKLSSEIKTIRNQLLNKEKELFKANELMKKLQENCLISDKQADELEILYSKLEEEKKAVEIEVQKSIEFNKNLQSDLNILRKDMAEERRIHQEISKCFEDKLEKYESDLQSKNEAYAMLKIDYDNELSKRLEFESSIEMIENEIINKESLIDSLYEDLNKINNDLVTVKEDLALQKTINDKLECKKEELYRALEETKMHYDLLMADYENNDEYFKRKNYQLETTVKQHSKLLNLVLSKSETTKKPLFGIHSPKISKNRFIEAKTLELSHTLSKEREKNKNLIAEIDETKKQLQNCLDKIVFYESSFGPVNDNHKNDLQINKNKEFENYFENPPCSSSPSAPSINDNYDLHSNCSTTDDNEVDTLSSCKETLETSSFEYKHNSHKDAHFSFTNSIIEELDK